MNRLFCLLIHDMGRPISIIITIFCLQVQVQAESPAKTVENRPTLQFEIISETAKRITHAFDLSISNLIDTNSISYNIQKWNDTGLLDTTKNRFFLRAAPSYGSNPWVHDGAYNTWSAMNLLEANDGKYSPVAKNTLWACCDGRYENLIVNLPESNKSEWYMYQMWIISAWNYYKISGDAGFLNDAYLAAVNTLTKHEQQHLNRKYGLFEGSYFIGDGIAGFPEPPMNPEIHNSNSFFHPGAHKSMMLSTNCVYVGAYNAASEMAKELGKTQDEISAHALKAEKLSGQINKYLWIPSKGLYGFFIHGTGAQSEGLLDDTQEGSGISFAIIFGVADSIKTRQILKNVHRQPQGITMSWPHFSRFSDEKPGRHNASIWPQVSGLFAHASCLGDRIDLFESEILNIAELYHKSGTIREIYQHITGEPFGGYQMNRKGEIGYWGSVNNQAWGAGGFLRMIFYGLFGFNFETDGVRFTPALPAEWGSVKLSNLRYRDMTLNIMLSGFGNRIRSVTINGVYAKEAFMLSSLKGVQNIEIQLYE